MKTNLHCFPCLLRQCVDLLERGVSDVGQREQILRGFLQELGEADWDIPAPVLSRIAFDRVVASTGRPDPLRGAKIEANRMALALLPKLRKRVEADPDPFAAAVRLAIAGNVVDLGAKRNVDLADVMEAVEQAFSQQLPKADVDVFRARAEAADSILYLTDNAGEIVFDLLLLERLPRGRVTVAVRGAPTINDATREDAAAIGLADLYPVIDNGSRFAGTLLSDCSADFRQGFDAADLIISKGQGNFETLGSVKAPVWFLFKVKCQAVAELAGRPLGAQVLLPIGD